MSSDGTVTHWIGQLKAGDQIAAQPLWERYFQRLVGLAHRKLRDLPRRAADEEDVALSAFHSFCRGAERGRFPQLADRDDLWRLLVVITVRHALDLGRDQRRQKRGGGAVSGESGLNQFTNSTAGIEQVVGSEPTPEFAAQVGEECRHLLAVLGDDNLRAIAVQKMEGWTNDEIAQELACTLRTVERKLGLIRQIWEREIAS